VSPYAPPHPPQYPQDNDERGGVHRKHALSRHGNDGASPARRIRKEFRHGRQFTHDDRVHCRYQADLTHPPPHPRHHRHGHQLGAALGLVFSLGWFANALGMYLLGATGRRLPARILLGIEVVGTILASIFQVIELPLLGQTAGQVLGGLHTTLGWFLIGYTVFRAGKLTARD
jgi:hypothetical protein